MRADRLLSIIWLLRAHQKLSAAELAERLEVSRRTIMRDIDALSGAGVPVYCERGPRGGVRLLAGYRTEVTGLSSEESRALFAGVTTWGADSLGLGEALASGLRKLLAAVPESDRHEASSMSARVVIDPQGWLPQTDAEQTGQVFRRVQTAVFEQRQLQIDYRSKSRHSTRKLIVEPHGLISAGRSWYLCATAHGNTAHGNGARSQDAWGKADEELRFMKLARIEDAQVLSEPCAGRAVDVAKAWQEHRSRFLDGFSPVAVTGWVKESRWSDAHEWALTAKAAHPTGVGPGEGWAFMQLGFGDELHALTVLLRLGPDAVVVSPESLRQSLTDYLKSTLQHYL